MRGRDPRIDTASPPHGLPGRARQWRAHEIRHMKPPLPRTLSAVPRLPHVQLEIVKAILTLVAPSVDKSGGSLETTAPDDNYALARRIFRTSLREEFYKAGFRSDQPRWRRGSGRRSGRWSGGAGGVITDQAYRRLRGGHHYVPREIFDDLFKKNQLRPETRKVFDEAVTGPLPKGLHKNDRPHREYTKAVLGLWHQFLGRLGIRSEDMTPDQARKFIHEVLHSDDPRISLYNGRFRR
jgi:hypothetical protein